MRLLLKLLFYAAAIAALCWFVPQIATSFNRATAAGSTPDASRAYALFALYLLAGAVLAIFAAWDAAHFFGDMAGRLFWSGGRIASLTPAWWRAERLCKERQPLDAIRVLRDYLNTHPRQWRISVRIAEIYQHEIEDALPAALEYEELLKQRLPDTARAEITLRLAACYLLLHRPDDSAAKLREVIETFPRTPAAEKAERRLARMRELQSLQPPT